MSKGTSEAGQVDTGATTGEVTGRYAIDAERRAATVVPPTTPEAEELSLDALDAVMEAAPAGSKPATVPPPVPPQARSHASGLSPARSRAPVAAVEPVPVAEDEGQMDSLRPFYKELEGSARERAQVDIADLSLQPDNPYLASSLVPPAEKPPATGRIVVGIAALIAFAAGGYFAFVRAPAAPVERPSARAAAPSIEPATESVATPAAPVPAAAEQVAPPAPVAQPVAVEPTAEAKVEAAPPVVEASPAPSPAAKPAEVAAAPAETVGTATGPAPASVPAAPQPALAGVDAKPAEPVAVVGGEPPSSAAVTVAAAPAVPAHAASAAAVSEPTTNAAAGTATTAAPASLPETPTREEVAAGFDALRPELLQCAAGKTGVVVIDATLANTGRVAYALVDGTAFKGTPEGSCMARAIRKARFPLFVQATLKVRYPVQL